MVVGYCAPAIGAVALYSPFFTLPQSHLGPAYYLFQIGDALEVVALVTAVIALVARSTTRARPSVKSIRISVLAALLLAVSVTMNLTRLPGMSRYTPVRIELTVGFWLAALSSAALFVLVGSLRHHDRPTRVTSVAATIG